MTTENISVTPADRSDSRRTAETDDAHPAAPASHAAEQRPETHDAATEDPAAALSTPDVAGDDLTSDPSPAAEAPSVHQHADAEHSLPSGPSQDETPAAPQEQATAENTEPPEAQEAVERPPEQPRRRVQLKPTCSADVAKPIPSLGIRSPSEGAESPASPPVATVPSAPQLPAKEASHAEEAAEAASPTEDAEVASVPHSATAAQADPAADIADTASAAEDAAASTAATPPPAPSAAPVALPPRDEALDADIEAELNAALSGSSGGAAEVEMGDIAADPKTAIAPEEQDVSKGARLNGTVQSIHGDDMFIEFGLRMAGVLSRRQFGLRKQPMQGEAITVVVSRIDENEGLIHVNLPSSASRVRGNWDEVSVDQTVECQVNQTNKGGLEVSVGGLRGFMPASQVELGYVADLSIYVGQKLRAQVTEVNPKRRKLVLSRRKVLEEEREQTEQDLFQKIAPGQTYEGRVKTIKDYGAFVDIGGIDGLLHVGQISWSRVHHPKDVLTEGQQIEVKVLSVDTEKKKIGLGMRQLSQNPWKTAEDKFASGSVVKGKVTRIENFGGFIELEPGIEGLVHISELDHKRIKTVGEVLRVGQEVDVQVLEVDPSRKRISLSVKALKDKPEDAPHPEESAPVRRQSPESLKGGIGEPTGGKLFGDPRKFGR